MSNAEGSEGAGIPGEADRDLAALRDSLDEQVPAKVLDRNLLLATWNIRGFGGVTPRWVSGRGDSPKRDLQSIHSIAEIVSRFDVVAIQEVKSNTAALRHVYRVLGDDWSLILTDVTEGELGNRERMAFLFDTRRVRLSGLACEIVIPPEHLERREADALTRQFARTPYAVGFRTAGHTITLVSLHVIWGDSSEERARELSAIARWLAEWSRDKDAWDHNLITLGDFNIEREDSVFHRAFTSTGLFIPPDLRTARRSIFDGATKAGLAVYDQIAWFEGVKRARPLTLRYAGGGSFDFTATALGSRNLPPAELSWYLSDHLPLWVEFEVPA
jgi:endonuclease/exonuclease/phosphatase family metal-dependent hydrolase